MHQPLESAAVAPRPHPAGEPAHPERPDQGDADAPGASSAGLVGGPAEPSGGRAAGQQDEQPSTSGRGAADQGGDAPGDIDELISMLEGQLALGDNSKRELLCRLRRERVLPSLDLAGVAQLIRAGKARRIICMVGAGVSCSAGIPDFRTPGTGLYSQLERFGLPEPEAVFTLSYFRRNPKPFHLLAKELFPGNFRPTPAHCFMRLLADKGRLLRVFTQNIDSLEREAGLPSDAIVAAHGNFDSAHCIKCGAEHSLEAVKAAVFADDICSCTQCGGLVKPDIVFFGEQLPDRFYQRMEIDLPSCDLLLVMGTSLMVHPFASLIDAVPHHVPRLLINRERVGEGKGMGGGGRLAALLGLSGGGGFVFEGADGAYRDVLFLGDTDDGVRQLADLLGWRDELEQLVASFGGSEGASGSSGCSSGSGNGSAAGGTDSSGGRGAARAAAAGSSQAPDDGADGSSSGSSSSGSSSSGNAAAATL